MYTARDLNKAMLLDKQNQLLMVYQDLESIAEIPLDLTSTEGQSWIRSISFRIVQVLGQTYIGSALIGFADEEPPAEESCGTVERLVDALFYFLELILLSNSQDVMLIWPDYMKRTKSNSDLRFVWSDLYWKCTIEIVKLNQFLRRRGTVVDFDKRGYDYILQRIYKYLCTIFIEHGKSPEDVETDYLAKWKVDMHQAQTALVERQKRGFTELLRVSLTSPDSPKTESPLSSFFSLNNPGNKIKKRK